VRGNGENWTIVARKERSEVVMDKEPSTSLDAPSPSLSEFEAFLDKEYKY
jgi:hypothetical protein